MRILRIILFPFSLLYGLIVWIRNYLFDAGILKSASFDIPVICVGNLSVGGTGKTPMIEYLLLLLSPNYKTATLSRGYGRKSKGFKILNGDETAREVGDEPLQFKCKFKNAVIAVDEERVRGINNLLKLESPRVILLDDALQHRNVKAGLNILLTTCGNLYSSDFLLPTGNLREPVTGAKRADIVIVTKCPPTITEKEQERIRKKLQLKKKQKLFFSYINYNEHILNENENILINTWAEQKIALVTGIANPKPLLDYLEQHQIDYTHYNFPDHHIFSEGELAEIRKASKILTTEKDYMRLKDKIAGANLYYIPIKMKFIKGAAQFDKLIDGFIQNKK